MDLSRIPDWRTRQVSPHTKRKLIFIGKYLPAYTAATKKARQRYYIDGFAGPGLCRVQRTGETLLGSPLHALETPVPFTKAWFIEIDTIVARALEVNLRELYPDRRNYELLSGWDCNIAVPRIVRQLNPQWQPTLVLLDTDSFTNIRWNTLEALSHFPKVEIVMLFFSSHLFRMLPKETSKFAVRPQVITDSYGSTYWEEVYWDDTLSWTEKRQRLLAGYLNNLASIGYTRQVVELIRLESNRAPIYHIIWLGHRDNPGAATGHRIIRDIFDRDPSGQVGLRLRY